MRHVSFLLLVSLLLTPCPIFAAEDTPLATGYCSPKDWKCMCETLGGPDAYNVVDNNCTTYSFYAKLMCDLEGIGCITLRIFCSPNYDHTLTVIQILPGLW